jgi:hypothetical protein
MPPPGAKGPATAKAERSADPSDPRGSVRRRAFLGSTRGSGARTRRKNARPWPRGRQREPTPPLPRRQDPARMQEASVAEGMRKHRPGNGLGASRPGWHAFGQKARSGEGTRLRAAAVEAGSDAGLHLRQGDCIAGERDAWIAHPAATNAACGDASLAPLPLAGGAGGGNHLAPCLAKITAWRAVPAPRPWGNRRCGCSHRTLPGPRGSS